MPDSPQERTTLEVPTELERGDAFADIAVLLTVGLLEWRMALLGLWLYVLPLWLLAGLWCLSGEPITDMPFVGAIAAGFRRRTGLRRGHEWIVAYGHYLHVRHIQPRLDRRFPRAPKPSKLLKATLELVPTSNFVMSSPREQADAMESLARVLMGLPYRVQLRSRSRPVKYRYDWPKPPTLERSWTAVVRAKDDAQLLLRVRTLRESIEGVGLRSNRLLVEDERSQAALADMCQRRRIELRLIEPPRPKVKVHPDCVEVDGMFGATLVLRLWPREVSPGWLGQALSDDELPVDAAIHVKPEDAQRVARFLRKQQQWQTEVGPTRDAANELGKKDAESTRQKLIARTDRPVRVCVVLTVWGNDRKQLAERVEMLDHQIGLVLADVRLAKFEQDWGYEATQGTGRCRMLGVWRLLDCTSVASTWTMQPGTVVHDEGADLGTTHEGGMLVRFNPFDASLESFGVVVIAKVGAGKSFLLKLIARRLKGVELYIVEQRRPAEYTGLPHAHVLNLADYPIKQRPAVLRKWIEAIWEDSKKNPRPKLLILDELWSLLRREELAELIEEIARIGRHHFLSLLIATQQVRELLKSGQAVLDNAPTRIYLKQLDRDLDSLCETAGVPEKGRRFLRAALRGQALIDVGGMLVPVDIQATDEEYWDITTDPRDRYNGKADELVDGLVEHTNGVVAADRTDRGLDPVPAGAQGLRAADAGRGDPGVAA